MNNKAVLARERCDLTLMSGSICLTLNVVLDPVNIFHDGSTRTELKSRSGLKLAEWIKCKNLCCYELTVATLALSSSHVQSLKRERNVRGRTATLG